jgi:ABC-2 type transport system permease protein
VRARFSLRRVGAVARKELLHLRRDRLTGGMIAGIPLMMTLMFGYAINQDIRHLRGGIADLSGTQRGRWLAADAQATQVVDLVRQAGSARELETLLRRGEISVGILIPSDLEARLVRRDRPAAQLLVDGGDPIVLGAARALTQLPAPGRRVAHAGERGIGRSAGPGIGRSAPSPLFELRAFYNPERRSAVHIVPGICGVILALTMVLFTAIAIVRERERGNLELLITTPVQSAELMVGKILPYVVIGYVQISLILGLGVLLFDLPIRGSLLDLYAASSAFVVASLTLGLLISTVAASQFQAFQMTFTSFLPQIMLSGYMFPFDGMPRPAQWLAETFPLTHFLRIVRGIVLRGATLGDVAGELWPLALFLCVTLTLAAFRFRKRLD